MHNDIGSPIGILGALEQARASDPHDFAALYLRHRASFTLHARRYLKDQRDADEVVQEAFLRLFLALPELETELQALAYCRRTITNLAIDRYRADARRPRLVDLDSAPVGDVAGDDPGDPVVRAEDAALVRDALAQLPALHREALVKREIEEKPLSVIADELDIPEENVKHVLFRARRGMRKLLARTSVAPGADVEARRLARPGTSGAAALAVLLALVLGSGPDLEAVPVVGVDLPDVIGVTRLVETVADVVGDAVDSALPGEGEEQRGAATDRTRTSEPPTGPTADVPGPAERARVTDVPTGAEAAGPGSVGTVVPRAGGPVAGAPGSGPAASAGTSAGDSSGPGRGEPGQLPSVPAAGSRGPGREDPSAGTGTGADRGAAPGREQAERAARDQAERAAREKARDAEKAAKETSKSADQATRDSAKQADQATRDSAKQADQAAKEAERAAKESARAEQAAKESAKRAEQAARAPAEQAARASAEQARTAAKKQADTAARPAPEAATVLPG